MGRKLRELCLICIGKNLHRIQRAGKFLPTVHKEELVEWLAYHDMFTPDLLPFVTYNLFSPTLKRINLYKCSQVDDRFLKQLGASGCSLTYLTIHGCPNATDKGICYVTQDQKYLEELELRKLSLTENGVTQILSPKLWKLDLRGCQQLKTQGVKIVLQNNPQLKSLNLCHCTKLDENVFQTVAELLKETLEELIVSGLYLLDDDGLCSLAENCPNLNRLDVHGCNRITKTSMLKLFQNCVRLSALDLSYCKIHSPVESLCLTALPRSISELSLCGVLMEDETLLVECLQRLTSLKEVRLCGVPALNNDTLHQILKAIGPQLLTLDLSGSVTSTVTDEGLSAVSKYCNNLEVLALSLLQNITCITLLPLLQDSNRAASLRVLRLCCRKLNVDVLYAVSSNCDNLEVLDVSGLQCVDDHLLFAVAEKCHKLSHIHLKGCREVTDLGLAELARLCPLKYLVLSGIHNLTDKSIFALANSCPYLEEIFLNGCAMVSPAAVRYLLDCCLSRLYLQHKVPNADPNQLMAKNLDTGEFCRADLLSTS